MIILIGHLIDLTQRVIDQKKSMQNIEDFQCEMKKNDE